MAIYGINQHGSQMYINSIDDSDKLNVVKENGSIDSGSNGISDNSNSMPGDFADNQNSRNNAPKFSDPEKLFNIKRIMVLILQKNLLSLIRMI